VRAIIAARKSNKVDSATGEGIGLDTQDVRADLRVRQLRVRSQRGEQCEMRPVAADAELGVTFFAILLPWDTGLASSEALDADGEVLEGGRIRPQRRPPAM
jgi:hypothetical protein